MGQFGEENRAEGALEVFEVYIMGGTIREYIDDGTFPRTDSELVGVLVIR